MMLSSADFDELFSPRGKPNANQALHAPSSPTQLCIARWEDDGGRLLHRPEPRPAGERIPARRAPRSGYRIVDPTAVGIAIAIMPAIAAYAAGSAVLATANGLTRS